MEQSLLATRGHLYIHTYIYIHTHTLCLSSYYSYVLIYKSNKENTLPKPKRIIHTIERDGQRKQKNKMEGHMGLWEP